jgi:hypothetical protein
VSREQNAQHILTLYFSYLPGKTKEQAFRIGNEMADVITRQNPVPVKLKFEKVTISAREPGSCTHLEAGLPSLRAHGKKALCRIQVREP